MRKTLILAMFLVLPFLAACQGFMQPTPTPTHSPRCLWRAARRPARRGHLGRERGCLVPASPTMTPVLRQTIQPTATAAGQRIMALGVRPSLVLRVLPQAGAAVVATLPGSQVTWAEGRSPDGRWLRVAYGDAGALSVACPGDVNLLGEAADLPQVGPEAAGPRRPRRLHRQPGLRPRAFRAASPDACLPIRSTCAAVLGWIKP